MSKPDIARINMKMSQKSLVEIWQKRIRLDSSEPAATVAGSHTEEGSELLASSVKEAGVNIDKMTVLA